MSFWWELLRIECGKGEGQGEGGRYGKGRGQRWVIVKSAKICRRCTLDLMYSANSKLESQNFRQCHCTGGHCTVHSYCETGVTVSDYVKPMSWCCRRRACIWNGEPLGIGNRGYGGNGGGGEVSTQATRDQSGRESHHDAKEGFQVSKRGSGTGEGFPGRGGLSRGLCHVPPI